MSHSEPNETFFAQAAAVVHSIGNVTRKSKSGRVAVATFKAEHLLERFRQIQGRGDIDVSAEVEMVVRAMIAMQNRHTPERTLIKDADASALQRKSARLASLPDLVIPQDTLPQIGPQIDWITCSQCQDLPEPCTQRPGEQCATCRNMSIPCTNSKLPSDSLLDDRDRWAWHRDCQLAEQKLRATRRAIDGTDGVSAELLADERRAEDQLRRLIMPRHPKGQHRRRMDADV